MPLHQLRGALRELGARGPRHIASVQRVVEEGRLGKLWVPTGDGPVTWSNPYADHPMSDEQIGVAALFDGMALAVRFGADPLYSVPDALKDMEILTAMRYSVCAGGRPIALPLRTIVEPIRTMGSRNRGPPAHQACPTRLMDPPPVQGR